MKMQSKGMTVDTNLEYCLKFCYWLKNTVFSSSLAFLFLKVLCFPIMPDSCFWGVLQSFAISKLLRITVLTFLCPILYLMQDLFLP